VVLLLWVAVGWGREKREERREKREERREKREKRRPENESIRAC
jgi:hypothetical protein